MNAQEDGVLSKVRTTYKTRDKNTCMYFFSMTIVHHHLLYQAKVGNDDLGEDSQEKLEKFLYDLLKVIDMQCLIPAQLKFSHQKAWTGIVGVITSHVAFHFWTQERYVQLDIYSCKEFDRKKAVNFLNEFWRASEVNALFIDREIGKNFKIEKID
jgi:S-adenosylmethionine decarboxylase